ncbi:MAG: extracellular solute-binding protein [Tissierellales bacterium]|nr:extracellular solute-binding protein [Tissierellales bacterium]MBN2827382.1 extracellular solute-binding protein [Tissierellales bacterium]
MNKKKIMALVMAVMMIISLTACNSQNSATTAQTESTSAPESKAEQSDIQNDAGWYSEYYDAETMKGKTLNMYGVTDSDPILAEFTKDTGIVIANLVMKNGEILQRLINEKESGVVIADLWFTGGADTFISASQQGLLHPYKSPVGNELEDIMKDKDGYWHGTSLTLVNWVINTELIEKNNLIMPEAWEDLLQDGLKGEVSMSDPASSGTAYNTVSAILQVRGEEAGWEYLDKLIAQVPFFTARGSDPANMVINGEAIVGINASNGDREMEENNEHIKLVYPADGTGWWPQPVAIIEGTENLDEAKVFVDWILSKRGMEAYARIRNAAVARKDVEIPEGIININDINLFPVDFQANAESRDQILLDWAEHIQ